MTDSNPDHRRQIQEHERESEDLTFVGQCPSTVEKLLVSKQERRK
jgi:hypothetical protein